MDSSGGGFGLAIFTTAYPEVNIFIGSKCHHGDGYNCVVCRMAARNVYYFRIRAVIGVAMAFIKFNFKTFIGGAFALMNGFDCP